MHSVEHVVHQPQSSPFCLDTSRGTSEATDASRRRPALHQITGWLHLGTTFTTDGLAVITMEVLEKKVYSQGIGKQKQQEAAVEWGREKDRNLITFSALCVFSLLAVPECCVRPKSPCLPADISSGSLPPAWLLGFRHNLILPVVSVHIL